MSWADVRFQKKEAVVTFDPARARVEQMIDAVRRAGYRASLKPPGTELAVKGSPPRTVNSPQQ